jgi:dienelactone hydrolase
MWSRSSSAEGNGKNVIALLDDVRELRGTREVSDIVHMLPADKDHVLIAARTRTWPRTSNMSSYYNLYKANVVTGESSVAGKADRHTFMWLAESDGTPRVRWDGRRNGATRVLMRTAGGDWDVIARFGSREIDELKVIGFTGNPGVAIVADRRGGDRYALSEYQLASRTLGRLLLDHPAVDVGWPVGNVLSDDTGEMLGACFVDDVWYCRYFDTERNRLQQKFEAMFADSTAVRMISWSNDRKRIVIATSGPRNPGAYFLYDVAKDAVSTIGRRHPSLPQRELGETMVIRYTARDGAKIPGYLTLPPGKGEKNLPLVVMPHGGPETRDYAAFDPWVQMFANRGYAVLQPNFRGSGGYGKRFTEAGYRQWGRLMQDDITDGVKALVKEGTADPNRICIVGASYGGYAALAGGAFTPDLYKCVVSVSGISDIAKMMENEDYKAQGDSFTYDYWRRWVGDPAVDAEQMKAVSPINFAAKFRSPVLLIHGTDDDVALVSQSTSMKDALRKAGKQVELKLIENEGHALIQQGAKLYLLTEVERFVTAHLGK